MRRKIALALGLAAFTAGSYLAQESKKPPEGQAPAPSAAAPQVPHEYKITPAEKERKNPVAFTDLSVERGKKLYARECAMCHGERGDGKGDMASDLKAPPPDFTKPEVLAKRTDGELFTIMGQGSNVMPSEGKRLREQGKWDIVNFLRSVQGKVPAKATQKERDAAEHPATVPQ